MDTVALHHREEDSTIFVWMENWSNMPSVDDVRLDETCPLYRDVVARVLASEKHDGTAGYRFDVSIWGDCLWRIPERFQVAF